jgi:glycosyltransferase involved in cell wall biosynthesis
LVASTLNRAGAGRAVVVCIAYNHAEWIEETLESVRQQDYSNLQLIVVDNGSTDSTADKIRAWVAHSAGPLSVQTIYLTESQPYCRLFNRVIAPVECQFVIDLSGDDMLFPQHLSLSVNALRADPGAAFSFSDATIIDYTGAKSGFYERDKTGALINIPKLNDLYVTLISQSCVSSPTVVFDAPILKKEGGYDESLYYEDFDILVRLARKYRAAFSDHMGVVKRKHAHSMSAGQYLPYQSKMLPSTVRICEKIRQMNTSPEEDHALGVRILFELKHALWSANFTSARNLVDLGKKLGLKTPLFQMYCIWANAGWDISWLYLRLK